jgi:hypothetical protein
MLSTLEDEGWERGKLPSQRDGGTSRSLWDREERTGGQGTKHEMGPRAAGVRSGHETHIDYETRGSCLMLLHGYKTV